MNENNLSLLKNRIWTQKYHKDTPLDIDIPDEGYIDRIERSIIQYSSKTAFYFLDKEFTYQQMGEQMHGFAKGLIKLGIKKGDKVALYLANSPQFIFAYLGILKIGAVAVPINPLYTESEIEYILNDSKAKIIICLDLNYGNIEKIEKNTELEHVIVTNIADYLPKMKRMIGKLIKKIPTAKYSKSKTIEFKNAIEINQEKIEYEWYYRNS